jgi:hypothetical protein
MQYGVLNEILKCQSRLTSANGNSEARIIVEENHGGGYEAAHHVELLSAVAAAVIQPITVEG